jgi:hypothetical protein
MRTTSIEEVAMPDTTPVGTTITRLIAAGATEHALVDTK